MNIATRAIDLLVNPRRVSDPERLRAAVADKTVLVTGASDGLGEATAHKLVAAGATTLLVARSADKLNELRAALAEGGGRAIVYPADLSTIGVNYLGPIRLLLGLIPPMRQRGSGHDVNVSSIGVRVPPGPRWGTYQASKGVFDTWLRSVASELHSDGVDVTSIYLGLIRTRMTEPTPSLRRVPGLSAGEAADIVAKATIERPTTIEPWWTWPAEVTSVLLRAPVDRAARLWYRHTADSDTAHKIEQ
jgi:short-subunit dehydrogenase